MVFRSKQDLFFTVFLNLYTLFTLIMLYISFKNESNSISKWFAVIILILTYIFILSFWINTSYSINETSIFIRSGFIKLNIPINAIRKIKVGETKWVGLKLGLARKGLIVYYNKYDEVYISPLQVDLFIETLKSINPEIEVIKKTTN